MSSHFNYEIDERNLRVRLKDMVMPYKEEAWVQFENYSDTYKNSHKNHSLPRFQLNLNRNIILPAVFGVVIILFSLVLFNFITIKNKSAAEKPVVNPIVTEPQKTSIPTVTVTNDTTKIKVIDSIEIKAALALQQATVAATNSIAAVQNNSVQAIKIPETKTLAVVPVKTLTPEPIVRKDKGWITTESAEIFTAPDNKSEILISASANKMYEAIEETNYYIKVNFNKNGESQIGYIRKKQLRKL